MSSKLNHRHQWKGCELNWKYIEGNEKKTVYVNRDSKSSFIKTQGMPEFVLAECYVPGLPVVFLKKLIRPNLLLPFLVALSCKINLLVQSASSFLTFLHHRRCNSISMTRCSNATTPWAWKEGKWVLITHHWFWRVSLGWQSPHHK